MQSDELDTPTVARVVPKKIKRKNNFSAANNSRITKGIVEGYCTRNTRIAFGYGCDYPGYVNLKL